LLVGAPARNQWVLAPERTVRSIKRRMGTSDAVQLGDQQYTPQEISAFILRKLKERAEKQLSQPVHSEVDPDLCVAMGAAVQGGLIAGIDVGAVLVDITPHALGIQALSDIDGRMSHHCFVPLIKRNSPLPST
jgi:molecular chaperone DnaK